MRKLSTAIIFCLVFSFLMPTAPALANDASLYLSPGSGTFRVGSTFDISVFLNTGGNTVNTVQLDLKFDPTKLQVASPTAGKSLISVWVAPPTFSNTKGLISFQGGAPSPGINTSSGLISTITFRATAPGKALINILDSSTVLLNDGKGTSIPVSTGHGLFEITIPPPEGPIVHSTTHSDPYRWYKNNNPSFSWEVEPGMTGFSYALDQIPDTAPDNVSEGNEGNASFNDVRDGIWYFHLKSRKGNVWGGVSHYVVQIDNTPPANFEIEISPLLKTINTTVKNPTISFLTTDAASGLNYYEIKSIFLDKKENLGEEGFFIEATSPYRLAIEEPGEYEIVIRAYDWAGNFREATKRVEIVDSVKIFYVSKQGINILGISIAWWQLILITLILCVLAIFYIWQWKKNHDLLSQQKEAIEDLKAKIIANEQEIKKKLGKEKAKEIEKIEAEVNANKQKITAVIKDGENTQKE